MFRKFFSHDTLSLARFLSQSPDFVWLDSANGDGFSVMAFDSVSRKSFFKNSTPSDFLNFLDQQKLDINISESDLPSFCGGWIGYFCYEAYSFNPLIPFKPNHYPNYPLASFYEFDTFIFFNNNDLTKTFFSLSDKASEKFDAFITQLNRFSYSLHSAPSINVNLEQFVSKDRYTRNFKSILDLIHSGEFFELNYTIDFACPQHQNSFEIYCKLREKLHAPMMFYGNFSDIVILSASPERFFKIENSKIKTFPIKGTASRSDSITEDILLKSSLLQSEKNRAELLMITDLMRSDLGRICQGGSVKVNELVKLETFSHYHHLYSEIEGRLNSATELSDVFKALFPGGSITGAPKIKVMEHIDKIENRARGVYTGAIGYISRSGTVDFNIPIRTITADGSKLHFAAGGGIVADSQLEDEYNECLLKISGLQHVLF